MLYCPKCYQGNPDDALFCISCGASLHQPANTLNNIPILCSGAYNPTTLEFIRPSGSQWKPSMCLLPVEIKHDTK